MEATKFYGCEVVSLHIQLCQSAVHGINVMILIVKTVQICLQCKSIANTLGAYRSVQQIIIK